MAAVPPPLQMSLLDVPSGLREESALSLGSGPTGGGPARPMTGAGNGLGLPRVPSVATIADGDSDAGSSVSGPPAAAPTRHELKHWNYPYKSWAASEGLAMPVVVTKVSAGNSHTLLLTATGEAWSFGAGQRGQLGHGVIQEACPNPTFVRALYGHEVVDVAAGGWHSIFVTRPGELFGCGDNRHGQLGLGHRDTLALPARSAVVEPPFPGSGPKDVAFAKAAAGQFHTLLLSQAPCVWTCGSNNWGQLGVLFGAEEDSAIPRPLLSLQSVQPCKVACGTNHSLVVTEGGDLWTWGRGDCGQLGHGDRRSRHEPALVKELREVWVISADGGDFHSVACADNGETYTFGSGEHGQLGQGVSTKLVTTPQQIITTTPLTEDGAFAVAAGGEHTLIQMRSGDLLSMGNGGSGRLGHDNQKSLFVARSVRGIKQTATKREEVDALFPIKDLRPLDPPNAADAEAEELSLMGAALAMLKDSVRKQYTDAELMEMKRCFDQIDLDKGGTLDSDELQQAFVAMGETISMPELEKVILEVDENGNGEVEFDEFVMMVSNMRSGKSSFRLAMLLSLLPDGNEVSENARNRVAAYGSAIKSANIRLEARRVFAELDLDHSGLLSASEIKIGLRRMGVPFVTNAHVVKMIAEFDDNGDNAISESEFIDHYGKLFERRDSSIVGRIIHYLVFHPPARVSQLRSQRFVERFRAECVVRGVPIGPELEERLVNIGLQETTHGSAIKFGKLDLFNTGLRDTHLAALADTIIAYPIVQQIRLTRNHVTDAGVASIIAVQIAQSSQAASSEGAGGVRAVVMPPSVKGFGAVMTERELEAQQERFEASEAEAATAAEAAMKAALGSPSKRAKKRNWALGGRGSLQAARGRPLTGGEGSLSPTGGGVAPLGGDRPLSSGTLSMQRSPTRQPPRSAGGEGTVAPSLRSTSLPGRPFSSHGLWGEPRSSDDLLTLEDEDGHASAGAEGTAGIGTVEGSSGKYGRQGATDAGVGASGHPSLTVTTRPPSSGGARASVGEVGGTEPVAVVPVSKLAASGAARAVSPSRERRTGGRRRESPTSKRGSLQKGTGTIVATSPPRQAPLGSPDAEYPEAERPSSVHGLWGRLGFTRARKSAPRPSASAAAAADVAGSEASAAVGPLRLSVVGEGSAGSRPPSRGAASLGTSASAPAFPTGSAPAATPTTMFPSLARRSTATTASGGGGAGGGGGGDGSVPSVGRATTAGAGSVGLPVIPSDRAPGHGGTVAVPKVTATKKKVGIALSDSDDEEEDGSDSDGSFAEGSKQGGDGQLEAHATHTKAKDSGELLRHRMKMGTQLALFDHMDEGGEEESVRLATKQQPTHNVAVRVRLEAKREAPPSQMGPSRKENACIGLISCRSCGVSDERYPFAFVGLKGRFVRYGEINQCRNCGYEWSDPVHFVTGVTITDYLKPERLLVLAKYRLQTEARDMMYGLVQIRRHSAEEIQEHHLELVKVHVNEFSKAARAAGALGLRKSRLVGELLRYGVDAFSFVENEYYKYTSGFLCQYVTVNANEYMKRCRAMYKIAGVPRETDKFFRALQFSMEAAKADSVLAMNGWTIRKRDAFNAFSILAVVYEQLVAYYRHVIDNIAVDTMTAGAAYSLVTTRGGSGWAFGAGNVGQIGLGTLKPHLAPRVVLMARPINEGLVSNAYRIYMHEASAWFGKCSIGVVVTNVKRNARVVFDGHIIPEGFIGVRLRVRSALGGGVIAIRAGSNDGPLLGSVVVPCTVPATSIDGEPDWALVEGPAVKQLDGRIHPIIVHFGSDDCADVEWLEFFV